MGAKNEFVESLAKQVQSRRKELGVTQSELADLAQVSARFVYDLERGKATISLDRALLVAEAVGLRFRLEIAFDE